MKICKTLTMATNQIGREDVKWLACGPVIEEAQRIVLLFWPYKNEFSVHTEYFESFPLGRETTANSSLENGHYFKSNQLAEAVKEFSKLVSLLDVGRCIDRHIANLTD